MTSTVMETPSHVNLKQLLSESVVRYDEMIPEARREEWHHLELSTIQNAVKMAAMIWSMKKNGDDMSHVRRSCRSMYRVLLEIGSGRLALEAIRVWGVDPNYLLALKKLEPSEQERLCRESVPVVERRDDGSFSHRKLNASEIIEDNLTPQVFGDDGAIRTVEEQEVWLERKERQAERLRPKRKPETVEIGRAVIDRVQRVVRVGKLIFTFEEWREINDNLGE